MRVGLRAALAFFFALAVTIALLKLSRRQDEIVKIKQGALRGVRDGGTWSWRGIPYAAPPTGLLRLRTPQPPLGWEGTRDATNFGANCIQPRSPSISGPPGTARGSEDCLTLNVWRPARDNNTQLPVLFFVHGGAGVWGSGSDYDGARLADRANAIVVTVNYRLGPLGFLSHPSLRQEDPNGISGNYGLLDLIAALEWVQAEIDSFGGSKDQVLVFGHSAGGALVAGLVSSPRAASLFTAVVIHSGTPFAAPRDLADRNGNALAEALDCKAPSDVLQCLRMTSPGLISAAGEARSQAEDARLPTWGLVVDGTILKYSPIEAVNAAEHNHVALIVGNTSTELLPHQLHAIFKRPITTEADLQRATRWLGSRQADALSLYPRADYRSAGSVLAALESDRGIICPTQVLAAAAASSQREPVWRFVFSHSFDDEFWGRLGVRHGIDLEFILPSRPRASALPTLSAREQALSATMMRYWTRLAATGDPNGGSDPLWPRYLPEQNNFLSLAPDITTGSAGRTEACAFWDSISSP